MAESEIPEDVMKMATAAAASIPLPFDHFRICEAIAAAIMAERERCAQIAVAKAREMEPSFMADAAWDVAAAIRQPEDREAIMQELADEAQKLGLGY